MEILMCTCRPMSLAYIGLDSQISTVSAST
jgi:hypothetical protein